MKASFALLLFLFSISACLQTTLKDPLTCFGFESGEGQQMRELYYNFEPGRKISVSIKQLGSNFILNSSSPQSHSQYLQLHTTHHAEHQICFQSSESELIPVQFELIDEKYLLDHVVGKEDVLKVVGSATRMLQRLSKASINQKTMIMEHHRRTENLKETSKELMWGTAIKVAVIGTVLLAQFIVVKKIFK